MLEVISITGVVFLIVGIGFFSVRFGMFSQADMRVFGKYVINFALPALIFRAVSGRSVVEILDVGFLGAYLAGSLLMFAGGYLWSRRVAGLPPIASTFRGMGVSCSNSGFFGYPILLMAMPPIAATVIAKCMVVENLILIPLVLVMAERAGGGTTRGWALAAQIAGRLLRNPMVLALLAGLAVSLLGLDLPKIVAEPIRLLAASSAAVSLVVIGGTLAGQKLRSIDLRLLPVILGKLLLHPLALWLGMIVFAAIGFAVTDPRFANALILIGAMPSMAIYPILAQRYGQQDAAALALFVMTGLSFFTLSFFMWLLGAA